MAEKRRAGTDRRTGKNRRKAFGLNRLFFRGAERRRVLKEQRSPVERRMGWVRMNKWSSVFLKDLKIAKFLRNRNRD